jgi:WD40 repeat protein
VTGVAFTADNQRFVAARGNTIGVWKLGSDKTGAFSWPGGLVWGEQIRALAPAPDSGHVVLGQASLLRYCRLDDGKEVRHASGHAYPITSVAVTPDGRRAVSASDDHTVRVWDLKSGRELGRFTAHTAPVLAVAVSPDGRLAASAGLDQTVRLIELPE